MNHVGQVTLVLPDYMWTLLRELAASNHGSVDKEVETRLKAILAKYLDHEKVKDE